VEVIRAKLRRSSRAMWLVAAALGGCGAMAAPAIAGEEGAEADHFAPLAFLAGECWKGSFPDGKATDEHCFEWMFGGKFLRDRHVVEGRETPYQGETIYAWDPARNAIVYWYVNSDGGFSTGALHVEGDSLVFPDETYVNEGVELRFRSVWRRDGSDAYVAKTEQKVGDAWREAWTVRFIPVTASPSTKP
jgi:hypothetical protein